MYTSRLPYERGSSRWERPGWPAHLEACSAAHDGSPEIESCTDVAVQGVAECRPVPHGGQADVCWEETGTCTGRTAGGGVQASRERGAEITSGESHGPAGGGPRGTDLSPSHPASVSGGRGTGTSGRRSQEELVVLLSRRACGHTPRRASQQGAGDPGRIPLPNTVARRCVNGRSTRGCRPPA
jgi:hypothetical protein